MGGALLPRVHREVTGQDLNWPEEDSSGMGGAELRVLREVAAEQSLPDGLLIELFDAERRQHGMNRRSRIYENIDAVLKKDWRPASEIPGTVPFDAQDKEEIP